MRLLHQRHDRRGKGTAQPDASPGSRAGQTGARRQSVPLRDPHANCERGDARRRILGEAAMTQTLMTQNVEALAISRRGWLKSGGALIVSFALSAAIPKPGSAQKGTARGAADGAAQPFDHTQVDPSQVDSFLAI